MTAGIALDVETLLEATNPIVRVPAQGGLPEIVLQAPKIADLVKVIQASLDELNRQMSDERVQSIIADAAVKDREVSEETVKENIVAISSAFRLRGLSITHLEMLALQATLPDLPEQNIVILHQKAKAVDHPVVDAAWRLCRFEGVPRRRGEQGEDPAEGEEGQAGESTTVRPSM